MSYNEIRWHPLLGTWVIVASGRATRPWRDVSCPFCPGAPETGYGWDVLSLENRYPSLSRSPRASSAMAGYSKSEPGYGVCKVVIETPEHEGDLDTVPYQNLVKYVQVLAKETEELYRDERIKYVAAFRNKGEIIGVSLHHPHSQIYALPFIPLKIMIEMSEMRRYRDTTSRCLICDISGEEGRSGARILYDNGDFMLLLPAFAQWPYECHVYPTRHIQLLSQMAPREVERLADMLKVAVSMYNSLYGFSLPYMMVTHQAPNIQDNEHYHLHIEFYPVHRAPDKLKFAAGIEWGYWAFTYDELPENRVRELREALQRGATTLRKSGYTPMGRPTAP